MQGIAVSVLANSFMAQRVPAKDTASDDDSNALICWPAFEWLAIDVTAPLEAPKPCQAAAVAATRSGNDPEALPGRIRNQMEYMAGRNTKVKIVPAKVPPISVYASVPQKTE